MRPWCSVPASRLPLLAITGVCVGALIVLGVALVHFQADKLQSAQMNQAALDIDSLATALLVPLRAALADTKVAAETIRLSPSPEALRLATADSPTPLFGQLPSDSAIHLQIAYASNINQQLFNTLVSNTSGNVINLLEGAMPLSAVATVVTIHGIQTRQMLWTELPSASPGMHVVLMLPVYAKASSAADTWGWPVQWSARECWTGQLACYNASSSVKWWGHVLLGINGTAWASMANTDLLSGRALNYGQRISIIEEEPALQAPVVLNSSLNNCLAPVVSTLRQLVPGMQILVEVCIVSGWDVPWKAPLLVLVVVLPLLLGIIASVAVFKWMRHSELLQSLLPKSTIKHLVRTRASMEEADHRITGSPSEKLVAILRMFLGGTSPSHEDVMELILELQQGADLYLPANLAEHMRQTVGQDEEVIEALIQALVPNASATGLPDEATSPVMRTSTISPCFDDTRYSGLINALQSITGIRSLSPNTNEGAAKEPDSSEYYSSTGLFLLGPTAQVNQEQCLPRSELSCLFAPLACPAPCPSTSRLECVLTTATRLDGTFNAWELNLVSEHHPLSSLAYWCFHESGLIASMGLSGRHLAKFLRTVEAGYLTNPYHNKIHAADVLQSVHAFLHTAELRGKHLDNVDIIACYLAAVIHDYNHHGVTNDFLITTGHELAMRYNDASPHENHHISAALSLLNQPECNFLVSWTKVERSKLRKLVIDLVLATDMKRHFSLVASFNSQYQLAVIKKQADSTSSQLAEITGITNTLRKSSTTQFGKNAARLTGPASGPLAGCGAQSVVVTVDQFPVAQDSPPEVQPMRDVDKLLTMQAMLKCADLGHTCAALDLHLIWVDALQKEMFLQGDLERQLAMPVSPLCNREGMGITHSQVSFYEVVVLPLLKVFTSRYLKALPALRAATANYHYWKAKQNM